MTTIWQQGRSKKRRIEPSREEGFALVTAMLALVSLTVLGVNAMTNTTIETMIAGNDYKSDARLLASDGCVNIALASLADLLYGTNGGGTMLSIPVGNMTFPMLFRNVDDLLNFDVNFDDITPVLNAYLLRNNDIQTGETINTLCTLNATDVYTIHLEDNEGESSEDGNAARDADGFVYLLARLNTQVGNTTRTEDMVKLTLRDTTSLFDGTVNLINPDPSQSDPVLAIQNSNTKIDFGDPDDPSTWQGVVDGGTDKEGMVISDNLADTNDDLFHTVETNRVLPDGIIENRYQPDFEELSDFVRRLINGMTPSAEADETIVSSSQNTTLLGSINNPKVSYIKGKLVMQDGAVGGGILILDVLYGGGVLQNQYAGGLVMEGTARYDGLIVLLPQDSNYDQQLEVTLQGDATLNGALIALSTNQVAGIRYAVRETASARYDASNMLRALRDNRYQVVQWSYK